jgi:hypothetical protein
MVVAMTAPEPLLKVIEPENPLPLAPESPTPDTVVPRRAWQEPVTVQPATHEGVRSNVATPVAPDPPPEKDTVGGTT